MPSSPSALVTGSSRGIGAAIAHTLAGAGAHVWVSGQSLERAGSVAEAIRAAGGAADALALDVTDAASVAAAAAAVGELDWLVNNAGIAESAPLLPRAGASNDAGYARQFAVNLHGVRRLTEAFAPAMVARGSGSIVNVVSSAGLRGYAYTAGYTASKHAALGYTRVCALELVRKGLGVHAVCPHYVDSPMTDESVRRIVEKTGRSPAEARAALAAQNPGGRLVSMDEVAAQVLELARAGARALLCELDGSPTPIVSEL